MTEMEENSKTKGAVFGKQDSKGNTALHAAAMSGKTSSINVLVKLGASLEERNRRGETPLFLAASSRQEEAAIVLLGHGADPLAADEEGTTVLHVAASLGLHRLLEHLGNKFGEKKKQSVSQTCAAKQTSESSEEPSEDGNDIAKNKAVQKESTLSLDLFEPNNDCISNDKVKFENVRSWQDIYKISESLQLSSDSEEEGAVQDNIGGTMKSRRAYIEAVSKSTFDLKVVDKYGNTLLHLAALFGVKRAMRRFLKTKPDVNVRGNLGCTPLILAGKCGCVTMIKDLLSAGADINASNDDGLTALHLAVGFNKISAVRTLIQCGADLDMKDIDGNAPLHRAVMVNSSQSVLALIKGGALTEIINNKGITPSELAALTNNSHLYDILIRFKFYNNMFIKHKKQ